MELYKTANAQILFVCEALHNTSQTDQGKERAWDKIILVLVQRDQQNKAVRTCKYFLDVPAAKVIFSDVLAVHQKLLWKEYKKFGGYEKGVKFESNAEGLTVSVFNRPEGEQGKGDTLFFRFDWFQARCLAVSVLDHCKSYELAKALSMELSTRQNERQSDGGFDFPEPPELSEPVGAAHKGKFNSQKPPEPDFPEPDAPF